MPFRVPSYVGIPVVVVLFVFLYVTGLGELLLHVNEVVSPALALTVAGIVLGTATYVDLRGKKRAGHAAETGEDVEPEATATSEHEHAAASPSLPGGQHTH
jgi:hypothetical protein